MNKNEQATSNRRDSGTISRGFVANAALIGAGLAVAPLLGFDAESGRERPTRENNGPTKAAGGSSMEARNLGALEVSAPGHGCMSISRSDAADVFALRCAA